jgi:Lon protease-like protein
VAEQKAEIPLFPLSTVLMPGASLPLHIFEPRYRQLTIELVTGKVPNREFGVIAVREGWTPDRHGIRGLHSIGCTAELLDVQRLPDGRFDILTRGARRFRLCTLDADAAPYLTGTVEWIPDESSEAPAETIAALTWAARAAYRRYCSTAWKPDDWQEPDAAVAPATLPHLLAADCLLPIGCRQQLLESTSPTRRLRIVRNLLDRETRLLGELRAVPAPLSSYGVEISCN